MRIATMSREVLYEDQSGPRAKVAFDSEYRLGTDNDESYVEIQGVGEGTHIRVTDIPFIIEGLQEAARLDEIARAA